MRLQNKFKKAFIMPLLCGIYISIFVSSILIYLFFTNLASDSDLISKFMEAETNKDLPIITITKRIISMRVQHCIDLVIILKNYYEFYSTILNGNIDDTLIENYSYSGNYDDYRKESNNTDNVGFWYLNPQFKNYNYLKYYDVYKRNKTIDYNITDDTVNLIKKQLTVLVKMTQIFHSIYMVNEKNETTKFTNLYMASLSSKLIYFYPGWNQSFEYYNNFSDIPNGCKNESMIKPNYYYFPCRPWFEQTNTLYNENTEPIVINDRYEFVNGGYGYTICTKFTDNLLNRSKSIEGNYNFLCLDIQLNDIYSHLDDFNQNFLSDYLFVIRVNSMVPFYYPVMMNSSNNILSKEFNNQTIFSINELLNYKQILNNITAKSNVNKIDEIINFNGSYYKSDVIYYFTVYPLMFKMNNVSSQILGVVYVYKNKTFIDSLNEIKVLYSKPLIFSILVMIIMGVILMFVAWYLIKAIANNIIKPIRNLKNLLKEMKKSELENNKINSLNYDDITEEDESEDEENLIKIRSKEIEELFINILKLKNVISLTNDCNIRNDKLILFDYIGAKYTFDEVQNQEGSDLCHSNLGNLAMKFKKYEKAIFHLLESLKSHRKNDITYDLLKIPERKKNFTREINKLCK